MISIGRVRCDANTEELRHMWVRRQTNTHVRIDYRASICKVIDYRSSRHCNHRCCCKVSSLSLSVIIDVVVKSAHYCLKIAIAIDIVIASSL